jgi:hypothetical protein
VIVPRLRHYAYVEINLSSYSSVILLCDATGHYESQKKESSFNAHTAHGTPLCTKRCRGLSLESASVTGRL